MPRRYYDDPLFDWAAPAPPARVYRSPHDPRVVQPAVPVPPRRHPPAARPAHVPVAPEPFDPPEPRRPVRVPVRDTNPTPVARDPVRAPAPIPAEPPSTAPADAPRDADRAALRAAMRDLEAARHRVDRDAARVADDTRDRLVAELFPVLDNLDRSIQAARAANETGTPEADGLLAGLDLVRSQFESVLGGWGLRRIDSVGHRFDPAVHEAVALAQVDDPEQDGVVVDEWQPGYQRADRVLRPAKVRVGKLAA
jgi:molecular chaperone GrpE (heat shock protein)